HSKKIQQFIEAKELRLGLLVPSVLDKFFSGRPWDQKHWSFESVEVTDEILKHQSIDEIWTANVQEILKSDQRRQAELKRAKDKNDVIETAFNRYQLFESIGNGAAGWVRRAEDSDGNEVAIKILNPVLATSQRRKRFQNEILFSSHVRHPHIITVLYSG